MLLQNIYFSIASPVDPNEQQVAVRRVVGHPAYNVSAAAFVSPRTQTYID